MARSIETVAGAESSFSQNIIAKVADTQELRKELQNVNFMRLPQMFHSPAAAKLCILSPQMDANSPVAQFISKTTTSLADATFVRLALSSPVGTGDVPKKILGRFVRIKGVSQLSLTLRHNTRDVTRNLPISEVATWLAGELPSSFRCAMLGTTTRDWQFISDKNGTARLVDHRPKTSAAPSREHDQKHQGVLDANARDWLQGLDVLDRDGKVRASMADKHRQINRYLEIVSHLAKECGWSGAAASQTPLRFADMGCGKGYLTFGLWHLFHRIWKRPVQVIGVETRPDLVATTNALARRLPADGLSFIAGDIASAKLSNVDALIALHACNTATDDAIRRGIELGAKLIIVSPCCHKELRPQLGKPEPLGPVLRHGVMEERMAEWATDGLRALYLEWAGYRTKVMEFVASEHTPKNLMIAAVLEHEPFQNEEGRRRIKRFKEFFGVATHALDPLLNPCASPAK